MRRILTTAIALALAGAGGAAHAQSTAAAPAAAAAAVTTQLPRDVRPTNYDIEVEPHADRMAFDGKVRINVDVLAPTRSITLNAADLEFGTVRLERANGKALAPKTSVDAAAQTATFTFDQALPAGSYLLTIEYNGKIGTQANGLFALDYADRSRQEARALHPVRELRCAPLHPVLGRAGAQGHVPAGGDRAVRADGGQQHAGGQHARPGRRAHADPVQAVAEDVDLPAVPVGWASSIAPPSPTAAWRSA